MTRCIAKQSTLSLWDNQGTLSCFTPSHHWPRGFQIGVRDPDSPTVHAHTPGCLLGAACLLQQAACYWEGPVGLIGSGSSLAQTHHHLCIPAVWRGRLLRRRYYVHMTSTRQRSVEKEQHKLHTTGFMSDYRACFCSCKKLCEECKLMYLPPLRCMSKAATMHYGYTCTNVVPSGLWTLAMLRDHSSGLLMTSDGNQEEPADCSRPLHLDSSRNAPSPSPRSSG
ncbi:hypothetical protein GW7_12066 [Heterocephalus glaber]|uniref:Uncharacterized protein n=1 Tax=Heterocephalus glaber TaxID=10181 RepID=G5C086_HETGA|nr:hypothetical protein GW7_12066 [Heterocephalus glaber]